MRLALTLLLVISLPIAFAQDAAAFRENGIQALKDSDADPRKLADAARAFIKAADLYAAAGDEAGATEVNSFLYWCRKKMTLQDIDQFAKSGDAAAAEKLNAIEKTDAKTGEAQKSFDRAEKFAKASPSEHLLIAIRYFEVADRFKDSDLGRAAMSRSLEAMQKVIAAQKSQAAPVKPVTPAKPGKTINLLALIDPSKDAVSGKWRWEGAVLVGEKSKESNAERLEIPYHPPEEYDFRVVFMRTDGAEVLGQIGSKSEHQFAWFMDGWNNSHSGIEMVDGKGAKENASTIKAHLVPNKQWHTSVIQVRNSGIAILLNGKQIAQLKTNYSNLGLHPNWKLRDPNLLGLLHSGANTIAFSTIELIEMNGTGKKAR